MNIAELSFLVVEDHEFQRNMAVRILEKLGSKKIFLAADGGTALAILNAKDSPINIVISDLKMPGMDGMEFMRHLGKSALPISIIIASGMGASLLAQVETMTRAYGVTILGVIEKPVTLSNLAALIDLYKPASALPVVARNPAPSVSLEEIVNGLQNEEFEPFFQPKADMATGQIKGAEALARWRHPHKGIIEPSEFIALMEANGLIDELTWMMLKKSALFGVKLQSINDLKVPLTLSVNLSVKSLADTQLAERVTAIVASNGLDPRHMILEVTESAAMSDIGIVLENLARLRMQHFGLSIDDYGTGYSSMQQLSRIAFTELKIDQSFVAHASNHESSRIIIKSSLDLARKLNIDSVAEGVETQEQWDLLKQLGCQVVQGYFIAKPMAADDFLEWVKSRGDIDILTKDLTLSHDF